MGLFGALGRTLRPCIISLSPISPPIRYRPVRTLRDEGSLCLCAAFMAGTDLVVVGAHSGGERGGWGGVGGG